MESKYEYCQQDINYCFFELKMVLAQFNYNYGWVMFGFTTLPISSKDIVAIWRVKSTK